MGISGAETDSVEVLDELKRLIQGTICVLGVGNRQRRDDGAGSLIAKALAQRMSGVVIDGGSVPENYLEKLVQSGPDTIVIIDAVNFDGTPGEIRLLDPYDLAPGRVSTHGASLELSARYLRARTHAQLSLLAIQPAEIGPGEGLSEAVSRSVALLSRMLPKVLDDSRTNRMESA